MRCGSCVDNCPP
ncbi:MAG: hypothetical protein JSW59_01570 [Phycisphaerales bacterium]|nr:MAG: hypothetical protein JSW59_01570 [Phycisphaerales bacterium]